MINNYEAEYIMTQNPQPIYDGQGNVIAYRCTHPRKFKIVHYNFYDMEITEEIEVTDNDEQ